MSPAQRRMSPAQRRMSAVRRERGIACAVLVLAAAGLLGTLTQPWADVAAERQPPLADLLEHIGGRSLAPAIGGAALVVLAGAVAVLATSGWARRIVGALLCATGAAATLGALRLLDGPSAGRARELIADRSSGIGLSSGFGVDVHAHPAWPAAAAAMAFLVALAGLVVAIRGAGWSAMSARYDAPDPAPSRAVHASENGDGDLALWSALDKGEDPTRA